MEKGVRTKESTHHGNLFEGNIAGLAPPYRERDNQQNKIIWDSFYFY